MEESAADDTQEPQESQENTQGSSQKTVVQEDPPPLPGSQFEALRNRLQVQPHDTAAWQDLINTAEEYGNPEYIATAYESLLKVYPNTVSRCNKLSFISLGHPPSDKREKRLYLCLCFLVPRFLFA